MAEPIDPDATLMVRVREGDREAFEQLVEKFKQPVFNLICRTIQDPTEAEDLAQNVFVQVYRAAHRYHPGAKFSTWIFTIARNACLNEIRRRSRHPTESLEQAGNEHEDEPPRQYEDVQVTSPPQALLRAELFEKVNLALADLPETQRTALLLCQRGELSYEEIAKVIACSLSATKSLIHRARETLKQRLKPYLKTGVWQEDGPEKGAQL